MDGSVPRSRGRLGLTSILSLLLVGTQLIAAFIIVILVGIQFNRAGFSSAVYSIILSILTILTAFALIYLVLRPAQRRMIIIATFGWQVLFVILWAAAAGSLGSRGDRAGSTVLRAAMALAIIEMLTFVVGAVVGGLTLWRSRRQERKLTGGV